LGSHVEEGAAINLGDGVFSRLAGFGWVEVGSILRAAVWRDIEDVV
jgi:hypothetical protein